MLLHQKSPLCKHRLSTDHHYGEYNKPLTFVNAFTSAHNEEAPKKVIPKLKNDKIIKEKDQQAKQTPPRKYQHVIIVGSMYTTRQDAMKGIKFHLV